MPSSGLLEGLTLFAENTGLVVGRTLVNPSKWKVPVLVSNFSQDTVMVEPFSEVGMVAQISAIQSVTEPLCHPSSQRTFMICWTRHLGIWTAHSDVNWRASLPTYSDLFPVLGSTLTGHTDAVDHEIDTGDGSPIRCTPGRMSPQNDEKRRGVCCRDADRWSD